MRHEQHMKALYVRSIHVLCARGNLIYGNVTNAEDISMTRLDSSYMYQHSVKSVCIQSLSGPYFPAFVLNTDQTLNIVDDVSDFNIKK